MSTEKRIKNQAKALLDGNWLSIIVAVIAVFVVVILISCILTVALFSFKAIDIDNMQIIESKQWINACASAGVYFTAFLISPLINGIYKIIADIATKRNTEVNNLFFYFKGKKYFRTILLNLILGSIVCFLCNVTDIYQYAKLLIDVTAEDNAVITFALNILLSLIWIVSVIIKLFIYLLIAHYPLMAYAMNDTLPIKKYTIGMIEFSFRNFAAAIKLILSLTGWIALCFFVVPAFYVLPYTMTSLAVSAKWLFALNKDWSMLC